MNLDGIPLSALAGALTPAALLALTVVMILTGRLVPRRTLDDMTEDRDRWRNAAETRSQQVTELLVATHTSTAFIEATFQAAREKL